MEREFTIRGRVVTSEDIEFVRKVLTEHPDKGRTQISRIICLEWGWVQANGGLKEVACREMLRRLAAEGVVVLPRARAVGRVKGGGRRLQPTLDFAQRRIEGALKELLPIDVRMVRGTKEEGLFRELVDQHHYLGYRQIVGEHLKYIAFSGNRPVACIGWGAAAWKTRGRDEYIGWTAEARKRNLQLVANNTRFLILPWVRVPHLASFLLGQQKLDRIEVEVANLRQKLRYREKKAQEGVLWVFDAIVEEAGEVEQRQKNEKEIWRKAGTPGTRA